MLPYASQGLLGGHTTAPGGCMSRCLWLVAPRVGCAELARVSAPAPVAPSAGVYPHYPRLPSAAASGW
eukprot:7180156-Alexandrium_andersonii.AAC.1